MQYMTSGFRAAHGLPKANHDQEPYECTMSSTECHTPRPHRLASRLAGTRYVPRPEFDVPDNPILVAFRGRLRYQQMAKHAVKPSAMAAIWTTNLYRYTWDHQHDTPEFKHARRVLSKLAAVYA